MPSRDVTSMRIAASAFLKGSISSARQTSSRTTLLLSSGASRDWRSRSPCRQRAGSSPKADAISRNPRPLSASPDLQPGNAIFERETAAATVRTQRRGRLADTSHPVDDRDLPRRGDDNRVTDIGQHSSPRAVGSARMLTKCGGNWARPRRGPRTGGVSDRTRTSSASASSWAAVTAIGHGTAEVRRAPPRRHRDAARTRRSSRRAQIPFRPDVLGLKGHGPTMSSSRFAGRSRRGSPE